MGEKTDPTDAIGDRIRARRLALGLTLAQLAKLAGLKSASFVHYIEAGGKAPSEEVAARLAEVLGEDVEVFRAWARLRAGSSLADALTSARTILASRVLDHDEPTIDDPTERAAVAAIRSDPRHRAASVSFFGLDGSSRDRRADEGHGPADEPAAARAGPPVAIPILATGDPPAGEDLASRAIGYAVLGRRMVAAVPQLAAALGDLSDPFAYEIGPAEAKRARGLLAPAHYAIMTRQILPLEPHEAYGVLIEGRVVLSRLRWNGRSLLVTPSGGEDFVVLPASDEEALRRHIVGKVAILIPKAAASRRPLGPP